MSDEEMRISLVKTRHVSHRNDLHVGLCACLGETKDFNVSTNPLTYEYIYDEYMFSCFRYVIARMPVMYTKIPAT